ncbi:YoaK family protein [Pseudonocardia nigra]|uniref:YoaK family protein n=1 Tax=Pseudonocardia nigra TaxID=1921578 RepID=UPI001C5E0A68|nr:YoaK family protein [Pseudonocardia nigra]
MSSTSAAAPAGAAVRSRRDSWSLALMLALTFSTGVIDAVGYLGLDRVFTGNMTGNVVILGMGLAGAEDLPVLGPVVALVAFLAGAVAAGRVLKGAPAAWTVRTTVLLLLVGLVLAALAVGAALLGIDGAEPGEPGTVSAPLLLVTAALGFVMGAQAATARKLAVKDVTTVVVTSTLTGLAADSRLAGGTGAAWRRRAGAVALILLGAAAGAALLRWHLAAGLALSAVITIAVVVAGHLTARPT